MLRTGSIAWCLLLTACGSKPILPPGTGTGTGTGTGSSAAEGDCTDGADGDGDGLLDCEDDDCAGVPDCTEAVCDDGVDDDGDGLIDCADGDCWGNGCVVVQSRITTSGRVSWRELQLDATPLDGCAAYHVDTATMVLESPVGMVRYLSADAGRDGWVACNWSATRSVVFHANTSSPFSTPRLLLREGFTIDADCPLQGSLSLPQVVTLDIGTGERAMRTGSTGQGGVWWGMTGPPTPVDVTSVGGPVHSASSCDFSLAGVRSTVSWATPDVGFDFTLVGRVDSSSTTP